MKNPSKFPIKSLFSFQCHFSRGRFLHPSLNKCRLMNSLLLESFFVLSIYKFLSLSLSFFPILINIWFKILFHFTYFSYFSSPFLQGCNVQLVFYYYNYHFICSSIYPNPFDHEILIYFPSVFYELLK